MKRPIHRTTQTLFGVAVVACFGLLLAACSVEGPTAPSLDPAPVTLFPTPEVEDTPVVAEYSFEVDSTILTAIFVNESTGEPTSSFWDFGDGTTSFETSPVHTFPDFGSFVVTLTVTDAVSSDSISKFVVFEDEEDTTGAMP